MVKYLLIRNAENVFSKMIPRYEEIIGKFQLFAKIDNHDIIAYLVVYMLVNTATETALRKHAYSNILKISSSNTESFQIKF